MAAKKKTEKAEGQTAKQWARGEILAIADGELPGIMGRLQNVARALREESPEDAGQIFIVASMLEDVSKALAPMAAVQEELPFDSPKGEKKPRKPRKPKRATLDEAAVANGQSKPEMEAAGE